MSSFLLKEPNIAMDRGDGIIRWSPNRSRDEFLTINVSFRSLQLHRATGKVVPGKLEYEDASRATEFQAFGAFDWSPTTPGLIAIGTKSGEVHLHRVDDEVREPIVLPLKLQRSCQSVAFNTTGLLAVGLDRVRNDQCLQIWDINQRVLNWDKKGYRDDSSTAEPIYKMEPSVTISSARWFEDQPQTLVVGVKNQSVKIFDLRDPTGAVVSFQTRSNNNLAVNHRDPNYFASSSLDSPAVMIWDRRATSRHTSSKTYTDVIDSEDMPWGCALKLDRVIDPTYESNIRNLRYSRDESGLLGVLSASGELQLIQTGKEHYEHNPEDDVEGSPELVQVKKSHEVAFPYFSEDFSYPADNRIVSFDWVPIGSSYHQPRMIIRRANNDIDILLKPSSNQNLVMDLLDFSSRANHENRGALPKFAEEKEANEVLHPLLQEPIINDLDMSIDSRPSTASGKAKSESQKSTVIETVYVPTKDNADDKAYAERSIKASKGLFQGRMNSSRERHERFLTRQKYGVNADGPDQINALMLDRIKRGYVFNCLRNIELFEDDPWLQDVWTWVEGAEEAAVDDGMVSGRLDLSYVGVQNVWNNDLGSNWLSRITDPDDDHRVNDEEWIRALADLNARSRRSTFKSVPTKRPHHRLMCLAICGWGKSDEELERDLIRLEAKGLFTKAAAWALFEKKPRRAVDSLQRGGKNLLFIGLALSLQVNGAPVLRKEDWDSSMSDLSGMSDDPYLRAIYALISTGDWRAIANEASLPMRDRVGVALHNLDDTELPNWLNRQTAEAVRTGDIEGVVLVGITDQTVPLLSKYIEKFGDYQTASLLIHFAAPLYIDDFRIWQWRADYQDLHNKNRLFVDRCHYEAASTKKSRDRNTGVTVITPKPRQVTLRCMHCDTAFTNDVDNTSMRRSGQKSGAVMSSGDRNALYPSGVHAGICCPKCGKHLPRCGICLLTLGLPRSDKELSIGMEVGTKEKLKNFMSFCMKCDHAFHAEHARKWFGVHNECPVPECHCACNVDGGGMVGMEREGE